MRQVVPRVVLYGILVGLPLLTAARLRTVGPGPDPATTLRWITLGDGGRAAELITIHRSHEISKATSRYAIKNFEPPDFTAEWDRALDGFATMHVRGWIPLLFYYVIDTQMAPRSVREPYEIRKLDGWGRPYRVATRELPRNVSWDRDDPEVAADIAAGLYSSFFKLGSPRFDDRRDWLRLTLDSAGRDGALDTPDDIRFISYIVVNRVVEVGADRQEMRRQMDMAYQLGSHLFRLVGARYDLVDARLLVEHRVEMGL